MAPALRRNSAFAGSAFAGGGLRGALGGIGACAFMRRMGLARMAISDARIREARSYGQAAGCASFCEVTDDLQFWASTVSLLPRGNRRS
jgi:hypothetical protein